MIAQEMVTVFINKFKEAAHANGLTTGQGIALHTLKAVYPLILEQAAKVAENESYKEPDDGAYDTGYNHACRDCAEAIRNLKDKTDGQ